LRDYVNAQKILQKAVDIKPGHTISLEGLVYILLLQNKELSAIQHVQMQLAQQPSSPDLLLLYGSLLYKREKYEDALAAFRQVQKIAPDLPSAYMMEALTLKALGRFEEEIALKYREIAHRETVEPASQMVLAVLLELAGDMEGAKDAYRRVLQLSPDFPPAANNLAWILANDNSPGNLDEALNLARLAKEKLSNDPNIADTLGWVYYKKRQYYNAAMEFQYAIDNSPSTPQFHYHLALTLYAQDKKEEALNPLKNSLEVGGSFPESKKAEALYKKMTGKAFK